MAVGTASGEYAAIPAQYIIDGTHCIVTIPVQAVIPGIATGRATVFLVCPASHGLAAF